MLGERLMKLRKAQKWTQTELAERCKVSRNSIVNWETNKREPKIGDIMRLAEVLNVSPHELIASEEANVLQDIPQEPTNYAYWGGIVNEVRKLLERGDEGEILAITPLIKRAYDMLTQRITATKEAPIVQTVNSGHHNKNTQTVHIVTG